VVFTQQVRGRETGNTRTDDGNLHASFSNSVCRAMLRRAYG